MWHLGSRLSSDTLPYEETSTPATVQNKMPSWDQLRRLLAGSGLLLPQTQALSARMWPGEASRERADEVGGRTGGAVLARCPSCPPSPWISSRTRPLDLFIHQTHLLEIDWAGLCLFSSRPGEKPGHVTKQGRREETLGRQGEGALSHPDSTGLLAGPPGQGQKPSRKSARRGQAPRTWTSSSAPLTVRREVRSPGQFAAATAVGHLETETSSLALRGGHTHRKSRGQPISLTSQPRQQSRRLIFSPQIGAAFNIWYLAIHTVKRFQTWSA